MAQRACVLSWDITAVEHMRFHALPGQPISHTTFLLHCTTALHCTRTEDGMSLLIYERPEEGEEDPEADGPGHRIYFRQVDYAAYKQSLRAASASPGPPRLLLGVRI